MYKQSMERIEGLSVGSSNTWVYPGRKHCEEGRSPTKRFNLFQRVPLLALPGGDPGMKKKQDDHICAPISVSG